MQKPALKLTSCKVMHNFTILPQVVMIVQEIAETDNYHRTETLNYNMQSM